MMETLTFDWLMSEWLLAPCALDPEAIAATSASNKKICKTTIYGVIG